MVSFIHYRARDHQRGAPGVTNRNPETTQPACPGTRRNFTGLQHTGDVCDLADRNSPIRDIACSVRAALGNSSLRPDLDRHGLSTAAISFETR